MAKKRDRTRQREAGQQRANQPGRTPPVLASDPWGRTRDMEGRTLAAAGTQLEARGRHPFFQRVIEDYLGRLRLSGSDIVLDLGCGTGVVARAVARRLPSARLIAAVDISEPLIAMARRTADVEGLGQRIAFHVADACRPSLAEGIFDVVIMHTLLSHIDDPATVLVEARRLLRPGSGRLLVFDGDQASLTFATDASDGGAATDRLLQQAGVAHPRIMRAMPRLLADGGYELSEAAGYGITDAGRADFFAPALPAMRGLLPMVGAMSAAEAEVFVAGLERASASRRFFGAMAYYAFIARRPA